MVYKDGKIEFADREDVNEINCMPVAWPILRGQKSIYGFCVCAKWLCLQLTN